MQHELARLLVDIVGVDEDLADVGMEVVADRANDQAGLLVNEIGAGLQAFGVVHRLPELEEVVEVPLELVNGAANASGPGDEAHATWDLKLVHGLLELLPVLALDAAGDTTPSGVVGHEHKVPASERDEGRQRCAFVAALFLLNLNEELGALGDGFLDGGATHIDPGTKVLPGDLFEGEKAVPLFSVIDKAGLETGLNPSHDPFVDVALALFPASRLDVEIDQPLAIDDGDPQLFSVRGIKQHTFHINSPKRRAFARQNTALVAERERDGRYRPGECRQRPVGRAAGYEQGEGDRFNAAARQCAAAEGIRHGNIHAIHWFCCFLSMGPVTLSSRSVVTYNGLQDTSLSGFEPTDAEVIEPVH